MVNETERNNIVYLRHSLEGDIIKEVHYDAFLINTPLVSRLEHQPLYKHSFISTSAGLDKITLSLPLDYLNEDAPLKYRNGPISLRRHGAYVSIDIHGEYISHDKNILEQVKSVVHFLLNRGFFKVPVLKVELSYPEKEVLTVQEYEREIRNRDEFIQTILDNITLSGIEVRYDLETSVLPHLKKKEFNIVGESTYYSKDYRYYENGNKRKSMLCIYDKSKQMEEVKKCSLERQITRVEFRPNRYQMSKLGGLEALNSVFENLYQRLMPILVKSLKKLKISFENLIEKLEKGSALRNFLEKVSMIDKEREVYERKSEREDEENTFSCRMDSTLHWYHRIVSPVRAFKKFFYLIKTISLSYMYWFYRGLSP